MIGHLQIQFLPLIPDAALIGLTACAVAATGYALIRRSPGVWSRGLALAALLLALGHPVLLEENRAPLKDTALIVVDDSASMKLNDRAAQAAQALQSLTQKAEALGDLNIETIHVTGRAETDLFRAIAQKQAELPRDRLAGTILITDGQIHDIPATFAPNTPLHLLLAGRPDEKDRRLTIVQAPPYGVVGKDVTVTLRLDDEPKPLGENVNVTLHRDDGTTATLTLPVGTDVQFNLPVTRPGPNLLAFTTEALPGELTAANNSAAITVNGIRDRLRVLLVSGAPHAGERAWRNLLKSDPSVDLVHFTILRSPDKIDAIPNSELALIAFPVQELFEAKLKSFDLVIFDRFHHSSMIPAAYLENVARYVEEGGALLVADSTADDVTDHLSSSPLARVLPVESTHTILTGAFIPRVTEMGAKHPVTAPFHATTPGHWLRQTSGTPRAGAITLMSGLRDQPLLVLSRIGEGRAAQFMSDQFWLWARHYDGGGPEAELLRRASHWLMKEPELDETALTARMENTDTGEQIIVTERNLQDRQRPLAVTDPDGRATEATLTPGDQPGLLHATIPAPTTGLYRLRDGDREALAMTGANGAPEFGAMRATDEKLAALVKASGGGIVALADRPDGPDLRRTSATAAQSGWGWIGLKRSGAYSVTGSKERPLIPAWALLPLLLAATLIAWRLEGRK